MWYKLKICYKNTSGLGGTNSTSDSVLDNDGSRIDLSDTPLEYGHDDNAVRGNIRDRIEEFEDKKRGSKIEYARLVDENGGIVVENRGGKGSVKTRFGDMMKAQVFSHIHPRELGQLGGTFSMSDISNFSSPYYKILKTYRAAAKEGTYSISRGDNFNGEGLKKHYADVKKAADDAYIRRYSRIMNNAYRMTKEEYARQTAHAFNQYLVDLHNGLLKGQSQYGYTYALERRKR